MKITQRIARDRPVFSVEFFPPKDERGRGRAVAGDPPAGAAGPGVRLGHLRRGRLEPRPHHPDTARIATDTTLVPMAHLTAVSHSVAELRQVIGAYAAAGIRNVLAVRGDPPGDPLGEWVAHPEGLQLRRRAGAAGARAGRLLRRRGGVPLRPPALGRPRRATCDRLLAKIRAGADFAITQLFLEPEGFLRLRDRLAAAGCDVPLLPGIMPLTTVRTLRRGPELSGAPVPRRAGRAAGAPTPTTRRRSARPGMDATARAVRPAARRGRAGAALLHAEPVDGDGGAGAAGSGSARGALRGLAGSADRRADRGVAGAAGEQHHRAGATSATSAPSSRASSSAADGAFGSS